jgi:hypothetical protein
MNRDFGSPHALCKLAAWGLGRGELTKLSEWSNGVVILNIQYAVSKIITTDTLSLQALVSPARSYF